MSWEGYAQWICKNGHYTRGEPQGYGDDLPVCSICKADIAWENIVDETNCDSVGEIPRELLDKHFLISPAKIEKCNLGHNHEIEPAIYRVPTRYQTDPLRHYRPEYGGTPLVPLEKARILRLICRKINRKSR